MPKFRKNPIVVEAVQWTGDNLAEIKNFMHHEAISSASKTVEVLTR